MKKIFVMLAVLFTSFCVTPAFAAHGSDGKDRRIVIFNNSSQTIWRLQASSSTTDSWEEDILGDHVIISGDKKVANLYDGSDECIYDLRAVFKDRTEVTKYRVNICLVYGWSVSDGTSRVITGN